MTGEVKHVSPDENRKELGHSHAAPKGWALKKILPILAVVGGAVWGFVEYIGAQTNRIDSRIDAQTNRLDTKIDGLKTELHKESKEIRKLVSENTGQLKVLEERVSNVKTTTDKIDLKLDRLLRESRRGALVE